MLTLSHIENITNQLSSIEKINELESHDKQLYELLSKHYTLFVGSDVSQDDFSISVKKADCETIYTGIFFYHHAGFEEFYSTLNQLNQAGDFKFQVAIESTGPHHKALVRFLQEKEIEVFVYNPQTAKYLAKAHLKEEKTGVRSKEH